MQPQGREHAASGFLITIIVIPQSPDQIPVLGSPPPRPPPFGIPPPPTHSPSRICALCTRFAHEGPKTVICHEDRVPKTPVPCDSTIFRHDSHVRPPKSSTVDTSQRINKATVTRTAFRDRPDPCDSCNLMAIAPKAVTVTKIVALRSIKRQSLPGTWAEDTRRPTKETLRCLS